MMTRAKTRADNLIARNWRGELPLWVSYWIVGVAGSIVIVALEVGIGSIALDPALGGYNPRGILAILVANWVIVALFTTWQLVGIWRSASRYNTERRRIGKRPLWGGLAQVGVVLGVLRLLGDFGNSGAPEISAVYQMAFEDDPSIPNYSIRIMRNAREAEITGGLKYGVTDDFNRILQTAPQIGVVHLNSVGGRLGEAQKLRQLIRDRGLVTFVSNECLSACTLAFMGGRERWLLDGASLGFHGPGGLPGVSDVELAEATAEWKQTLVSAGVNSEFARKALAVPNNEMWKPLPAELLRAKVITAVSDGSNFAISGVGGNLTKPEFASKLTASLPLTNPLKERFPSKYDEVLDTLYSDYVDGLTLFEYISATQAKVIPLIVALRASSDDDVIVELGRLMSEQYKALGAIDPMECYYYASGVKQPRNLQQELPTALIERELALDARIISTAEPRPAPQEVVTTPLWEAVIQRLTARFGPDKLKLFQKTISPLDYADYCTLSAAMFEEITSLPQNDAALLMRVALSAK
jgi:hypothetical protein